MTGISGAFIDHLWQSTLFAGLVWITTLALRRNGARVRYWLWIAASVKFLLPLSWLTALGAQIEWQSPAAVQPAAAFVVEQVLSPPAPGIVLASPPQTSILPWTVIGIWLAGFAATLFWWWRQWMPLRSALRAATPLPLDDVYDTKGLRLLTSGAAFEPGVVGIWRPVLLVPDDLIAHLTPAQMNALIAHEHSHVRHRDNLFAAVHMVVEAIFWFHPLIWWIERRLIDERERACDEDVLRSGSHPDDYAEGILAVCRLNVRGPVPCVAGITGSNLRRRIESILRGALGRPVSAGQRAALVLAAAVCVGVPIAVGAINQDARKALRFEVASLRERDRSVPLGLVGMQRLPDRLVNRCATLTSLVFYAFRRTGSTPIEGLPGWATTPCSDADTRDTYEFEARIAPETTDDEARQMLQAFLIERFKLTFHWETRTLPIFALVVAPGGLKVKPTDPKDDPPRAPGSLACPAEDRRCGIIAMGSASTDQIAGALGRNVDRPVIDRTGLRGTYYFDVKYAGDAPASPLPSLPTALREQFGLELTPETGPVEVLIIDRTERPAPN
jgi:uncharacterized protein (TIGR03435 family)